jgi:hypothetical protein
MPRATRKPTATAAAEHPAAEPTISELCHEWRVLTAKLAYDLAALPETDDDGTNRLIDEADPRISEIEQALAKGDIDSLDDAQAILRVAIENLAEKSVIEEGDLNMVRAVRERRRGACGSAGSQGSIRISGERPSRAGQMGTH